MMESKECKIHCNCSIMPSSPMIRYLVLTCIGDGSSGVGRLGRSPGDGNGSEGEMFRMSNTWTVVCVY